MTNTKPAVQVRFLMVGGEEQEILFSRHDLEQAARFRKRLLSDETVEKVFPMKSVQVDAEEFLG